MTGLTADVNRRNFSAACPGPPQVRQLKNNLNLEFAIYKWTAKKKRTGFCRLLNKYCRNVQLPQDGAGSGKFRRELRARLCCTLFNAIPNTHTLLKSYRPKTRASLIAHIHESPDGRAHRRCKSAKFLRCPPRPTSTKATEN